MLLDPPLPLSATWSIATTLLTVVFDRPLIPGPTAAANWSGVIVHPVLPAFTDAPVPGTILGDTVTTLQPQGLPAAGLSRCNYLATPADVLNLDGVPAAPFTDFPVTVVP